MSSFFKEILETLKSVGFPQHVETKTGSRVVVTTKHTDQVASVLQTEIPDQLLAEIPSETHQQRTGGLAQGSAGPQPSKRDELAVHHVHIQAPSELSEAAAPRIHSPLHQSVATIQLWSHARAAGVTPAHEHLSVLKQQSADVSKDLLPEGGEESHTSIARTTAQPNSSPSAAASPRPPVLSSGEIHSKAQSMARGRLEKAKGHLLGRIQQAISLFGSGEISVPQVKRKQVLFHFVQFNSHRASVHAGIANQLLENVQVLHMLKTHGPKASQKSEKNEHKKKHTF